MSSYSSTQAGTIPLPVISKAGRKRQVRRRTKIAFVTLGTFAILAVFLAPLIYGASMSLKSKEQLVALDNSILPQTKATFHWQDQDLELFEVPQADGSAKNLAMLEKTRVQSTFLDPAAPESAPIVWQGNWRILKQVWKLDPQWKNFTKAWDKINFLNLLKNTALYALFNTLGILLSSSLVAYGFARFSFPGKKVLFMVIIATMILPPAVTTIPTYAFFHSIGWVGTWLPLIVPAFFANAYNVFLLRQFIMGIPRELDEAARIDGAGPFRTFWQIIVPQAIPGLVAAGLFNFFYCWNDFFGPLIYLAGHPELHPISVGLTMFNNQYTVQTELIQAASLIACAIPFVIFFFCQRFFMQGVVVTGVDK